MKIKPTIILALSLLASSTAAALTVEIDGVYYDLSGNVAKVTLPDDDPDFQYSGSLTIPSKVTYQSAEYTVDHYIGSTLTYSKVSELIVGEGFEEFRAFLTYDDKLESIHIKTTDLKAKLDSNDIEIRVGNYPGCAYLTHWIDGDKTVIHIDTFNVYGPNGQKLQPCLYNLFSDEMIEPDSDGNFILDQETYNEVNIIEMEPNWLVYLYCKIGDGFMMIGCYTNPYQTGINTTIDGINYMIAPQYAVVDTPAEGQTYSDEISVPEKITYEGKELPVTVIKSSAFADSEITSITLPSSITEIERYAFENCTNLVDVALPEHLSTIKGFVFRGCSSLENFTMGENVKAIGYCAFYGCESLKTLAVNEGTEISDAFPDCPSLLKADIIENSEEKVRIKVESNITTTDGEPLIPSVFISYYDSSCDPPYINTEFQPQDGIFTIIRSDDTFPSTTEAFYLYIFGNDPDGTYLPSVKSNSAPYYFSGITIPEPGQLGVSDETADTEAEAVLYNLQGVRVGSSDLRPGIYIKRQGSKASKILVR